MAYERLRNPYPRSDQEIRFNRGRGRPIDGSAQGPDFRSARAQRLRQDHNPQHSSRPYEADLRQLQSVWRGSSHIEALHRIGAIVETPAFYPYLSGRRNLAYFQGITGKGNRAELDSLLDTVGLGTRANDKFQNYSLGMKQRLGLAYALLGDPEILILDEPTNGMDPAGMAEMRDLVRRLGTGGRTVSSPATSSTRLRQSVTA